MAVSLITSIHRYVGVAADVATLSVTNIPQGSKFTALDTGAKYIFDGAAWVTDLTETTVTAQTLSAANDTVTAGYYGATTLHAVDADLAAVNIKTGVNIFGFTGTYDTEVGNPVVAARMKTGDVAFVNGSKITGSGTKTLDPANDTVPAGYYASTTLSAVDTDLATANIKAGVTIFGKAGKTEVVDTTEGVNGAVNADIALGKKAWVNGVEITGTHV